MEDKDEYACYLDMPAGLHVPRYDQKFVRAPLSQHPSKSPSLGKEMPSDTLAMKMAMGR